MPNIASAREPPRTPADRRGPKIRERPVRRRRRTATGILAAIAVAAAAAVAGCTSSRPAGNALAISVSQTACGGAWSASGGTRTFQLTNTGTVTIEVDLTDPTSGGVYAEVYGLAPQATRPMQVELGHGSYAFRCYPADNDAVTGPTVQISTGPSTGSEAENPVSTADLIPAVKSYDTYVDNGLAKLATDVAALDTAARGGTRAQAEAAWLTAHLQYNGLGAAYGTFGDLATAIDGLPDGHPQGVADKDFTGFHRIEYELWHGAPMTTVAQYTKQLATDVATLRTDFPKEEIAPNDLPLRAHEIIENTLQFQLTGAADLGSGTTLATAYANLDGDQEVLDVIAPVISTRDGSWASIAQWEALTRSDVEKAKRADGTWIAVADLDPALAHRIDADFGGLLEALAPVAAIGDVRRTQ